MLRLEDYWANYERLGFVRDVIPSGFKFTPPQTLGNGYFMVLGDFDKYIITISDLFFHKSLSILEDFPEPYLEFGQFYTGDVQYFQDEKKSYPVEHGLNYLVNFPFLTGYKRMEANIRLQCVGITYREAFFKDLKHPLPEDFWEMAAAVLNPKPITLPSLTLICDQIKNCRLTGVPLALFLEGKAMESFSITWDYIYTNKTSSGLRLSRQDREILERVKEELARDLKNPPSLKELARRLGMNQLKMMNGFKQLNQITIYRYLRRLRMEEAVRLLCNSDLSVAEIAQKVGYHGDGHFQQAFKEIYGTTPIKLRRELIH